MSKTKTRAYVITRIDFAMEVSAGPFGGDWSLDEVGKDGQRAAREQIERLVHVAAEAGIRLTTIKVSDGCTVKFEATEERGGHG